MATLVLKTNCLADAMREAKNDNYTCMNKKEKENRSERGEERQEEKKYAEQWVWRKGTHTYLFR